MAAFAFIGVFRRDWLIYLLGHMFFDAPSWSDVHRAQDNMTLNICGICSWFLSHRIYKALTKKVTLHDWVALPNLILRMAWQAGLIVFHSSISWSLKKTHNYWCLKMKSVRHKWKNLYQFFLESLKDSQVQL